MKMEVEAEVEGRGHLPNSVRSSATSEMLNMILRPTTNNTYKHNKRPPVSHHALWIMLALRLGRLRPAAAPRYPPLSSSTHSSSLPFSTVIRLGAASLHTTPSAHAKHIKRTTLTPAQRKALMKQQLLAAAIAAGPKIPGLEAGNKAADVRREERVPTSTVVTLDDLEPFNPHRPAKPRSREYRQQYAELAERLDNAFVRWQIVKLSRLLGLKDKKSDKKEVLIARVMAAAWDWTKPLTKEETTYTRGELCCG